MTDYDYEITRHYAIAAQSMILILGAAWLLLEQAQQSATTPTRRQPIEYVSFYWSLDQWGDEQIRRRLRFKRPQLQVLVQLLRIDAIEFRNHLKPTAEMALSMTIARLTRPRTLAEIGGWLGVSETFCSVVINDVLMYLSKRYLRTLRWSPVLNEQRMRTLATAIEKSCPGVNGVWGFIDGTFKPFSRLRRDQQAHYTGYKKQHGMKYQAITTPDRKISHLDGPWPAPLNDLTMLRRSGLEQHLAAVLQGQAPLWLFGDQAYKQCRFILPPYPGTRAILTPRKKRFNDRHSKARIAVENSFGLSQNLFLATAIKVALRKDAMPVAAYFEVAVLLTNCYTCFYGNLINRRFKISPPSIEDYLAL